MRSKYYFHKSIQLYLTNRKKERQKEREKEKNVLYQ